MKYRQQIDGEWITPKNPWRVKCCDCGLVHDLHFNIQGDGIMSVMVMRNERATGQVRRCDVALAEGSEIHRQILGALNAIIKPTDPIGLSRKRTAFNRLRGIYKCQATHIQHLRCLLREVCAKKRVPMDQCSATGRLLQRQITGGLKDAIRTHGPITASNMNSAVKRVFGQIKKGFNVNRD